MEFMSTKDRSAIVAWDPSREGKNIKIHTVTVRVQGNM